MTWIRHSLSPGGSCLFGPRRMLPSRNLAHCCQTIYLCVLIALHFLSETLICFVLLEGISCPFKSCQWTQISKNAAEGNSLAVSSSVEHTHPYNSEFLIFPICPQQMYMCSTNDILKCMKMLMKAIPIMVKNYDHQKLSIHQQYKR